MTSTGISTIRNRVSMVGMVRVTGFPSGLVLGGLWLKSVQRGIDALGQGRIDALDPGDFLDAGGLQARQSAEMFEQAGAPAWADAGDVLQAAGLARLLALAAMSGDGETMCLVAHLLHQLQSGRGRAGTQFAAIGQHQRLVARASGFALGHAD